MDADLGMHLADEMAKKGIRLVFDASMLPSKRRSREDSVKQVRLTNARNLAAECVLFATGRTPNTRWAWEGRCRLEEKWRRGGQ
jgi:glutathione reductase (NADPH)